MIELFNENTEILYRGMQARTNAVNPETAPIYPSTAYIIEDTTDYAFANNGGKYFYNRTGNPNRDGLAEAVSYLENGEKTLICSSGMGAISTTLLSLLNSGGHAVFSKDIYAETIELIELLKSHGIEITMADFTDLCSVKDSIRSNTKVFYTEIIANPLTQVVDIEQIALTAHKSGILVVVDSTFTTPFVIKPLNFGADIVVHSLTKFFGGHSDATGGSITASNEIIKHIRRTYLLLGAILDANTAWLFQRSIKTMSLRMKAQLANSSLLAKALEENPNVRHVYHPSLVSHPQHNLAERIFTNGYGTMMSFRVEDDRAKVDEFMHRLKIVKYLGTLGGIKTSIAHPASAFKNEFPPDELIKMGLYEGLIRISTGAEDINDLINDFNQALEVFS